MDITHTNQTHPKIMIQKKYSRNYYYIYIFLNKRYHQSVIYAHKLTIAYIYSHVAGTNTQNISTPTDITRPPMHW